MENIDLAQVFSVLSNPIRLRCLHLVYGHDDVCVCEVVQALGISQPAASKALGALKGIGLLESRRDANWTYYSLRVDITPWLDTVLKATISETATQSPYLDDRRAFEQLDLRGCATG